MKKHDVTLLATAPTEHDLLRSIAAYWYSPPAAYYIAKGKVMRSGDKTEVTATCDGVTVSYRVTQKRGRYRFEQITAAAPI